MNSAVSISRDLSEDELLAVEVLSTLLPFSRRFYKADKGIERKPPKALGCQWHRWRTHLSHLSPSATKLTRHWDIQAVEIPESKTTQGELVSTSVSNSAALEPRLAPDTQSVQSHTIKVYREIKALPQAHVRPSDLTLGHAELTSPCSTTPSGLNTPSGASPLPPSTRDSTCNTLSSPNNQSKRRKLNKECSASDDRSTTPFTPRRSMRKPPGPPTKTPERVEVALAKRKVPNGSMTPGKPLVSDTGPKKKNSKRKRSS